MPVLISNEDLARIIRDLKVRSQSKLRRRKPISPESKRIDDGLFKPPIPIAINEVVVETVDDFHYPPFEECELK